MIPKTKIVFSSLKKQLPLYSRLLERIHRAKCGTISIVLFGIYAIPIVCFSGIYYKYQLVDKESENAFALVIGNFEVVKSNGPCQLTYDECLYFSIICQSTVGFGDLSPKEGIGQFLAATQSLIGIILFALCSGVVVAKMLMPRFPLKISKYLVFNPDIGGFYSRVMVTNPTDVAGWETTFSARHDESAENRRYSAYRYPVLRWHYSHQIGEPGKVYLMPTLPLSTISEQCGDPPGYMQRIMTLEVAELQANWKNISKRLKDELGVQDSNPANTKSNPILLTPFNIDQFSSVTVRLRIDSHGIGNKSTTIKHYSLDDGTIVCGHFCKCIKRNQEGHIIEYRPNNFDGVALSNSDKCRFCIYVDGCTLIR